MTYRGILEQSGFKDILNTDFCILLQKDDIQYVIFKNTGIRCIDLSNFQELSLEQIQYFFGEEKSKSEEYEFTYSLDRENLINYLFGLIPFDSDLCQNIPNSDYFDQNLAIRQDENFPAVILTDKDGLKRNVLVFSNNFYKPLFSNRNCYLFTYNGEKELVVAYNPYHLLTFISKSNQYASILFLENTSETFLEIPLEYDFESYSLICSTASEFVEALRFIIKYINFGRAGQIEFSKANGRGKIEIVLDKDDELLQYIQLGATIQKTYKEIYPGNMSGNPFELKKMNLLNSKVFTISFNICYQELDILTGNLLSFYKVPIKFL